MEGIFRVLCLLGKMNAQSKLRQILQAHMQYVSVQVHHLQGDRNAGF
jgi:hypothetical protein